MKKVSSFIMAAALFAALTLTAGPAQAVLQALGPVNPANGYPFWYQDTNGLALSLCLDQNGFCVIDPLQNPLPVERADIDATNFPPEAFYFMADTSGSNANGSIQLELYEAAVESGFIGAVQDGGQAAFTRVRIRASVTAPGTYVVIHPYGTNTFQNVPTGTRGIDFSADVPGLVVLPFDQNHPSLAGSVAQPQVVGPFLTRADGITVTDPATGNKYIGIPGAAVAVTGSPTGNNFVRITGPAGTLQLNTFSLTGKIVGLEVTPQAGADFGIWKLNTPSTPISFTVTNRTGVDIPARDPNANPPEPGLVLTPSAGFSIPALTDTCADGLSAVPTDPTNACTFDVVFTPTDNVVTNGTISIANTLSPAVTIPVTGTGDSIAPIVTLDPVIAFTKQNTQIISGSVSDNSVVGSVQISVAGVSQGAAIITPGNPSTWTKTITLPNANAGNDISVTAIDTAQPGGNTSLPQTATITNDTINPVVSITAPANGSLISTRSPALTFNVVEINPAFNTVTVDNAPVNPVPATLATLADGQHTVRVDAGDSAGNAGIATTSFTVDATPPVITVTSPTPINQRIGATNPVLTFSINDANPDATKTVVTLDGTPVVNPVSGTTTLGPFTAGSAHTLTIDATDILGNVSPVSSVIFTVVLADGSVTSLGATPPTIADALIVLRHAVTLTTLDGDQFAHADVAPLDANGVPNPNNSVDIADALLILRKIVGLVNF